MWYDRQVTVEVVSELIELEIISWSRYDGRSDGRNVSELDSLGVPWQL